MASRIVEDRLGKVAQSYARRLLVASVSLYLIALILPAVAMPFSTKPVFGWECLQLWRDFPAMWSPNPLLFIAWIMLARRSRWSILPAGAAFGMMVYSFAGSQMSNPFLVGAYLWLAAILVALTAAILVLAAKRPRIQAHRQNMLSAGSGDFIGNVAQMHDSNLIP
jgi:hypothetical protein